MVAHSARFATIEGSGHVIEWVLGRAWPVLFAAAFAVVYSTSLSLVYVEGDDAATIAYHLLGRHPSVQPPYSAYQGMMDQALKFLPADERVLRSAAILATTVSAPIMAILMLYLVFDWISATARHRWLVSFLFLLCSPEFYFLGLYYSPSVVAMCFVLAAHIVLRRLQRDWDQLPALQLVVGIVASLALFGVGAACRWDISSYVAVIVTDLAIESGRPQVDRSATRKNLAFAVLWGGTALFSSLLAIRGSGYGLEDIIRSVLGSGNYATSAGVLSGSSSWWLLAFRSALLVSLVTPVFALLAAVGLVAFVRRRDPLLLVVLVGMLVVLPWMVRIGVPKMLLPAVPGLVCCAAKGLASIWDVSRHAKSGFLVRMGIISLAVAPWVIGIRMTYPGTAWGPGFELRPYDRTGLPDPHLAMVFGSGTAFSTFEGPRPLLGYAAVLLGGDWRSFVSQFAEEARSAVMRAVSLEVPLLVTETPDWLTANVLALGFSTSDPRDRFSRDGLLNERRFVGRDGKQFLVYGCEIAGGSLADFDRLGSIRDSNIVVLKGNSGTLKELYDIAPGAMRKLGPTSAILDLDLLRAALAPMVTDTERTRATATRCGRSPRDAGFG